jgi:hypothetical protein
MIIGYCMLDIRYSFFEPKMELIENDQTRSNVEA